MLGRTMTRNHQSLTACHSAVAKPASASYTPSNNIYLPQELLFIICGFLKDDNPSLKKLRLVNSTWSEIATPHLFSIVSLTIQSCSWAKLNKIARRPKLAKCVKDVLVISTGDEYGYPAWLQHLFNNVMTFELYHSGERSLHVSKSTYNKYRGWYKEAGEMKRRRDNWVFCPDLDLHKLPNLRCVRTLKHRGSTENGDKTLVEFILRSTRKTRFKIPLLQLNNLFETYLWVYPPWLNTFPEDNLHRFRLRLYSPIEARYIQTLELDLSFRRPVREGILLGPWIRNLPSLTTFKLVLNSLGRHEFVEPLEFLLVEWPALHTMHLRGLMINSSTLRHFIQKFRNTLRNFTLEEPLLYPEDSWMELLFWIDGVGLENFNYTSPLCNFSDPIEAVEEPDDSDETLSIEGLYDFPTWILTLRKNRMRYKLARKKWMETEKARKGRKARRTRRARKYR